MVIPNGVDLERIKNIGIRQVKKSYRFRMISVGRLIEIKNHKFLIDAFCILNKSIKNLKLAIVGEGYLKQN